MEDQIIKFMGKVLSGIDTTTAFIEAELPDFVHQLLTWHFTLSLVYFVSADTRADCRAKAD